MKLSLLWLASLLVIFSCSTAQQPSPMSDFNYDAAWKHIDTLVSENKVRDAQTEVEKIISAARADGASAQEIKGMLHSFVFAQPVEEQADSLIEAQTQTSHCFQ